jgi:SAM-dependent methyltransferase
MTQNIYDDDTFFRNYSKLPRSVEGLDGAPEWPTLRGLLPAMNGRRVLDLGCGFGWFCRWARENGAASVLGVDVSERMLARARVETRDPAVAYLRADLETFRPDAASFDLAYSSLAFHYLEDLGGLFGRIHAALAPGGRFVFSVEHPVMTAPADPAWSVDAQGRDIWPLSGYLDEGRRSTNWLADGVIKQHRTIATYVTLLRRAEFAVSQLVEWGPSHDQVAAHPEWKKERERPFFLLMGCDISH